MVFQKIVDPKNIENELYQIWQDLAFKQKIKASLFNLIVYAKNSKKLDYIRTIIASLVEKFPCRILFITHDSDSKIEYLKTAVSVIFSKDSKDNFACDSIDIGMAGKNIEKTYFLLLPHLLPDLPTYLFWADDIHNPFFSKLQSLSQRVIIDSNFSENLSNFLQLSKSYAEKNTFDLVDLNWVRGENWRNLFSFVFYTKEKLKMLENVGSMEIFYNNQKDAYFTYPYFRSFYLQAWLASCMKWKLIKYEFQKNRHLFQYENCQIFLTQSEENTSTNNILKIHFFTKSHEKIDFTRMDSQVKIEYTTPEKCEVPFYYVFKSTNIGSILAREMTNVGTSSHYLQMIDTLAKGKYD